MLGRVLLLASIVTTNVSPPLGQIGANYFDTLKQSQVWVNVEPKLAEAGSSGPGPVEMNVTVTFPDRTLADTPAEVTIRVQAYCLRFPTRIRVPELAIVLDGMALPIGDNGAPLNPFTGCGNSGSYDGVAVRLPFDQFRSMVHAERVEIRALGFMLALTKDDQRALGLLEAAVTGGATVK
jgi:hypothetical protein